MMKLKQLPLLAFLLVHTAMAKPNIVFFLVDDMGVRDAGCYGSVFYETPALDQLAKEGMRFTQAYAAHPRCVPSRFALMTGKFPAREGVPGQSYNLDGNDITMAAALQAGGYKTFFAGKWHLSKTEEQMPHNQGFDINIAGGHAGAPGSYFFPYRSKKGSHHKTEAAIRGLEDGEKGEYLNDRLTDETIAFIQQHKEENPEQPFFVYLSHYAVHTPLEAKAESIAHFQKKVDTTDYDSLHPPYIEKDGTTKTRQDNAIYAAMVKSMDESLGRIMTTLDQQGLAENTIIVFTSDHGGLSNRGATNQRQLATSNLPFRAGKGHCYEGGIRVPLVVKWPGKTPAGKVSNAIINGTDHFPTLLSAAGFEPMPKQHIDGINYSSALAGKNFSRPTPLFWHSPKGRPDSTGDHNCSVILKDQMKLIHVYGTNSSELYDLATDPYETNNLSEQRPELSAQLLRELNTWKQDVGVFIDKPKKKKAKH